MSPILTVRDLEWDKAPGQPVFSDVNFTVNEGDFVVLTGKSGCGSVYSSELGACIARAKRSDKSRKSTLLKCLAHLNLYSGAIEFRGQ